MNLEPIDMTKEQIDLMLIAARSVIEEATAGRSVDPNRLEWAHGITRYFDLRDSAAAASRGEEV